MFRVALLTTVAMAVVVVSPIAAGPGDALYTVTFDATWSATTHPQDFPANAHFSGLVGGTHDASVRFWAGGELASLGIQRMAEWGLQSVLAGEVQAALDAGSAGAVLLGPNVPTSPGSAALTFTATTSHPLVTLTTMIAPSPDWFLGVAGLDLRPGGAWLEEVTVELYPWDAGTDSGGSFASADLPTVPHVPVFAITGAPFTPGAPLGTFTFRLDPASVTPPTARLTATAYPNPFNPRTTIRYDLPRATHVNLRLYDQRGRLVRALAGGAMPPGQHSVEWDGRDARGRPSASGTYFVRLSTEHDSWTTKVTLAR